MRTNAKPLSLPPPIAAYFEADTGDADRLAQRFTENAVVIDERREHRGRAAIARWKGDAAAKYHYTSEPVEVETIGTGVMVIARLTGTFPGSPVDLRYHFTLEEDKIARLEITA